MSLAELIVFPNGTTYRRTGECDGCRRPGLRTGQCCTYVMLPLARGLNEDETRWLRLHHGMDIFETAEGFSVKVEIPCQHLTEDGLCAVFGSEHRPNMCALMPEWPGHLDGLVPGSCAYSFELLTPESV